MHPTWAVSPLIVYLFQCYSLRTSHPCLLPKSVLYVGVSFSVLHIGLSLPSFKIPYICISILYWCLSFWLTSLCIMGSSFIHLIRTDSFCCCCYYFLISWRLITLQYCSVFCHTLILMNSFYWLSNIPRCICIIASLLICLLMGI